MFEISHRSRPEISNSIKFRKHSILLNFHKSVTYCSMDGKRRKIDENDFNIKRKKKGELNDFGTYLWKTSPKIIINFI